MNIPWAVIVCFICFHGILESTALEEPAPVPTEASAMRDTVRDGGNLPPAANYHLLRRKISAMMELLTDDCGREVPMGNMTVPEIRLHPLLALLGNSTHPNISGEWLQGQIRWHRALMQRLKVTYRRCLGHLPITGQQPAHTSHRNAAVIETNSTVSGAWCRTSPQVMNLAHYYMPISNDGQDNGYVQKLPYTKSQCYTDVRVQWYGTVRAHYNVEGCGRWSVLFDGNECSDPGPIELVDYQHKRIDEHRMVEIDGICRGISKGPLTIGLHVGTCSGHGQTDSYTGWQNPRHIIIYEIDRREDMDKSCPGLSLFNEHQTASRSEDGSDSAGHVVKTLTLNKTEERTSVYTQYNSVAAVIYHNSAFNYCGRWYTTFNGRECSDPGPIDMIFRPTTNGNGAYNHRDKPFKHYSLHGICRGLPAGPVVIEVKVGPCYETPPAYRPDVLSGWNSWSRLLAQEVREQSPIREVIGSNGRLEPLPMFNIAQHVWNNINSDEDTGIIKSINYKKITNDTGLRLTWMGDHRHYSRGLSCGRWYFTIDGAECSNPGAISGVSYNDHAIDYHQPATISGICYGITAGNHTISYNVGKCPGYTLYDSYTGWMSSSRMIIMEVQVTTFKRCANAAGC